MPLFEFDCQSCEKSVEVLIRGKEKPICPECSSKKLSKRMSVPASVGASRSTAQASGPSCASNLPPCSPRCCRIPGR